MRLQHLQKPFRTTTRVTRLTHASHGFRQMVLTPKDTNEAIARKEMRPSMTSTSFSHGVEISCFRQQTTSMAPHQICCTCKTVQRLQHATLILPSSLEALAIRSRWRLVHRIPHSTLADLGRSMVPYNILLLVETSNHTLILISPTRYPMSCTLRPIDFVIFPEEQKPGTL